MPTSDRDPARPLASPPALTIDGSEGEGGGQVLRTALGLSLRAGTPFRIDDIRANRSPPGLRAQHVVAVEAAARIGQARVVGASVGSCRLDFFPTAVVPGTHQFSIGTAGSASLVLQTVLPALLDASGPSELVVEGGTHNPKAPPFEFFARAFLPLVRRMGPRVDAVLERPGFYPAGGGRIVVTIEPAPLRPLELLARGPVAGRRATAIVAGGLRRAVGERELAAACEELGWRDAADAAAPADRPAATLVVDEERRSRGPGNAVVIEVDVEAVLSGEPTTVTEVFTGFGEKGRPAELVAREAALECRRWAEANVPVGEHLADQLLLLLAIAGGGAFRTLALSGHAVTQIASVRRFLPARIEVTPVGPDVVDVRVHRA